jgi:hypothetical protein
VVAAWRAFRREIVVVLLSWRTCMAQTADASSRLYRLSQDRIQTFRLERIPHSHANHAECTDHSFEVDEWAKTPAEFVMPLFVICRGPVKGMQQSTLRRVPSVTSPSRVKTRSLMRCQTYLLLQPAKSMTSSGSCHQDTFACYSMSCARSHG